MEQGVNFSMELSKKQFDILTTLALTDVSLTQRQLEEKTGHSLGTINRVIKELTELGFVSEGSVTSFGLDALEPYRAKKAIFIAAGFGSRLVPVTLNTPKPITVRRYFSRYITVKIINRYPLKSAN